MHQKLDLLLDKHKWEKFLKHNVTVKMYQKVLGRLIAVMYPLDKQDLAPQKHKEGRNLLCHKLTLLKSIRSCLKSLM
jgi:hypothetical protein